MDIRKLYKLFLQSEGICTDSRKIAAGQLFFALSGENFDGNQFASQAIKEGAEYAIIDKQECQFNDKCILVPDVLKCLQDLGQFHRNSLGVPVIAITGSNGKTTTKELISSVLKEKFNIAFTRGNLNNHIGVPLTLLSFTKETEIGVVEMGANHGNEIERLCEIALPDFGIITNIGKAHLEGFGSFEGVIRAKNELYHYCRLNHKKVFVHGSDPLLMELSSGLKRITYGNNRSNEISGKFISASPYLSLSWKNQRINTQLVGEYNLPNVLAAIAVGAYFKIKADRINDAISAYSPQNNRSQLKKTGYNTLYIDAYNANPSSMDLSIRNFAKLEGKEKLLILGDMFELGQSSSEEHHKIVKLVSDLGFSKVIFVGSHFYPFQNGAKQNMNFYPSIEELINYLSQNRMKGYNILLKASRGIQLEKVISYL